MWFHLLSVVALIAVDSCLGSHHGLSLRGMDPVCDQEDCPCECPLDTCVPCPIPFPPECLMGCGAPLCPCPKPDNTTTGKEMARGISTINVFPTGPICSGTQVGPNKTLTFCSCVLGKPVHELYVTVNTRPIVEALKVHKLIIGPVVSKEPPLCLLVTEKPKNDVPIYELPQDGSAELLFIEYHKWEVLEKGRVYKPTKTEAPTYSNCTMDGKPRICVETVNVTTMGWNDIGTPFVEVVDNSSIVHGMYYGANLYKDEHTIVYLPLKEYVSFLRETV